MSHDEVRLLLIWGWFKVIFQHWRFALFLSMGSGVIWSKACLCAGSGIPSAFPLSFQCFQTFLSYDQLWACLTSSPLLNDSFHFSMCVLICWLTNDLLRRLTGQINLLKTTSLCRFTLWDNEWRKMKLLLRQGWKFEYHIQGKWAYQGYKDTWKYKILSLQIFIWFVGAGLEAFSKLELLEKGVTCLALMFCNSSAFAISEKKNHRCLKYFIWIVCTLYANWVKNNCN